jgi:hypothetical protein
MLKQRDVKLTVHIKVVGICLKSYGGSYVQERALVERESPLLGKLQIQLLQSK